MSRTIAEIQAEINTTLLTNFPTLTTSSVAQWRILTYSVAVAIYYVELMFESLTEELDNIADYSAAGTEDWYIQKVLAFQNGHELLYDPDTSALYYETDDEDSRIIKMVTVSENEKTIAFKVAKQKDDGTLEPLGSSEYINFTNYMNAIKFVGIPFTVTSLNADEIYYEATIYYDPRYVVSTLEEQIKEADDNLRVNTSFGTYFYKSQLQDAWLRVAGVQAVEMESVQIKSAGTDYRDATAVEELESGYFNIDYGSCVLTFVSTAYDS